MSLQDATPAPGLGRRFRSALVRLGAQAMDIIVPPACSACQSPLQAHHTLCAACWRDVAFIRPPLCDVTGIPLPFSTGERMVSARALAQPPAYDRARAVAQHSGAMRKLVHQFKYTDRHDALPLFGRWLAEAGRDLLADADVIVPVPMSRLRLILRHYNQSSLLARALAGITRIPAEHLALRRVRTTPRQVGLTGAQRRLNVAGAFRVPERLRHRVEGKRVLLLDDVITTGATAEACARALRRAGAVRVDVLALALVTDPASMSA